MILGQIPWETAAASLHPLGIVADVLLAGATVWLGFRLYRLEAQRDLADVHAVVALYSDAGQFRVDLVNRGHRDTSVVGTFVEVVEKENGRPVRRHGLSVRRVGSSEVNTEALVVRAGHRANLEFFFAWVGPEPATILAITIEFSIGENLVIPGNDIFRQDRRLWRT